MEPEIISVRENPELKNKTIEYLQKSWKSVLPIIYEDCIANSLNSKNPLPQWYLLQRHDEIIGCGGLVTNDFISRMDLYPWICALFIEEKERGNNYASLIINRAKNDARKSGFENVYLCTQHVGYYEKFGFKYIGQGYHPWNEASRIYEL
ncbi:MAG: GNAT family N-acetyltransferase, partial [Flavobacteriales bacterium]|nr:GNAT family N-acetyltransferase [Flavobacteriales bacterium]